MDDAMPKFEVPLALLENALTAGASLTARRGDALIPRPLSVLPLGAFGVRSGKLIVGDVGMMFSLSEPFVRRIQPGKYDVFVSIWGLKGRGRLSASDGMGDTPRAAYLSLVLSRETPVKYEFAAMGDNPVDWRPDSPFDGLGVDVGGVGLLDAQDLPAVQELAEAVDWSGLADEAYARSPECGGVAGRIRLPTKPPIESHMCESGWGDGSYFAYWGLNAANEPVVLIIDFDLDLKFTDY